jgi:periplasmic protein TonB
MAAQAPDVSPPLTPEAGGGMARDLFADLAAPRQGRRGTARILPISLAAHLLVGFAVIVMPLFWSSDPVPANAIEAILLGPPPPPPPPLSLGSPDAKPQPVQPKQPESIEKHATPKPETPQFVAPEDTKPVEPETATPSPEQAGSAQGQADGDPQGMLDGIKGGVVGGVPNGVLGGTLGGTGTVVTDYDEPPRLVKRGDPIMPQEAFVKGIKGTVEVEILIDETGRVVQARITRSIPALDKAALECVYRHVFLPARKHGRPVATIVEAPVTFTLI